MSGLINSLSVFLVKDDQFLSRISFVDVFRKTATLCSFSLLLNYRHGAFFFFRSINLSSTLRHDHLETFDALKFTFGERPVKESFSPFALF